MAINDEVARELEYLAALVRDYENERNDGTAERSDVERAADDLAEGVKKFLALRAQA